MMNFGTGSNPDVPHGLHLAMRFRASQLPFLGPCMLTACIEYSEQVGT